MKLPEKSFLRFIFEKKTSLGIEKNWKELKCKWKQKSNGNGQKNAIFESREKKAKIICIKAKIYFNCGGKFKNSSFFTSNDTKQIFYVKPNEF